MSSYRNGKGQFVKGKNIVDLTGERFGKLTVVKMSDKRVGRKTYWDCVCDCGNNRTVRSDSLQSTTKSCGCLKEEMDRINLTKAHRHKDSGKELHYRWLAMKGRCSNPKNNKFERYGGRGIKVCDEWFNSYESFRDWALDNGYRKGLSLERVDVHGDYEPANCTWIKVNEQAINRTTTVWVEWQGEKKNIKQWSEHFGISYGTLISRYRRSGMRPPELFDPVKTTPR